ncbi:MAG: PIG-L deacetylase family protein [Gemmatimonadales bacterium]|nr:PIG-L deacetylase family protein [Gemmatimonadales bacterium]
MRVDGPVLALGAHPDDVELGCGGTLARLVREGVVCHVLTFTDCAASNGGADMFAEAARAAQTIGVQIAGHLRLPVRELVSHRQAVADALVRVRDDLGPRCVLVHSATDVHQDHGVVAAEARRIFRTATVLAYEAPWSAGRFAPGLFVRLSAQDVERKLAALRAYESQAARHYFADGPVLGQLAVRGAQIACQHAEAFEVVRGIC